MGKRCKIPIEDYSFSDGYVDGRFNPNNLSLRDQKRYGNCLGFVFDLVSKREENKEILRAWLYAEPQINFFRENLNEGIDFKYNEKSDRERVRLHLYNPFLIEYYTRELPVCGPTLKRSILGGVLTNASLRTILRKDEKIIHVSKNKLTTREVAYFADLNKIDFSPLNYPCIIGGNLYWCYSLWFYDPKKVSNYLIPEFGLEEEVSKLPNFNTEPGAWIVLKAQANLRRKTTYDFMKCRGKLSITEYDEIMRELSRIEKQLREAARLLKKGEMNKEDLRKLTEYYNEIKEALHQERKTKYPRRPHRNIEEWKEIRSRELYYYRR